MNDSSDTAPKNGPERTVGRSWPDVAAEALIALGKLGPAVILAALVGFAIIKFFELYSAERAEARRDIESANKVLNETYTNQSSIFGSQITALDNAFKLQVRLQEEIEKARQKIKDADETKEEAVRTVLSVENTSYMPDANTDVLRQFIKVSPENRAALVTWMKSNKVNARFIETFLVGSKYKESRVRAMREFGLLD